MNVDTGNTRRHHPPGRRRRRLAHTGLATAFAVVAMATITVSSGSPVSAADAGATRSGTHAATPASLGVTQAAIGGLGAASSTIRLITGQQVVLNRDADGKYTVQQHVPSRMPSANGQPPAALEIHGETDPGSGDSTVTAVPTYAQHLVDSGVVDSHLFDITYLAANGYSTGTLPLVVHFKSASTAAAVAKNAAALPGATYVVGSATADQATVAVTPDAAATFWAAVTQTPASNPTTVTGKVWYDNPNAPQVLRDGIASLSLLDTIATAPTATGAQPGLTLPTYQLTVRIHGFTDPDHWFYANYQTGYDFSWLTGRTGTGAGALFDPSSIACTNVDTCGTLVITYNVAPGSYQFFFSGHVTHDYMFSNIMGYEPQIDLDADRSIDLYADDSTWDSLNTPKPNMIMGSAWTATYRIPDGRTFFDATIGDLPWYPNPGYVLRASGAVTAGTFSFQMDQIAEQKPIAMSVTSPHPARISLSPTYPQSRYLNGHEDLLSEQDTQSYDFPDGTHDYPVVYVGSGSAADFAGLDLTGKLALMRLNDGTNGQPCTVNTVGLQNAISAHAVGVLFDLTGSQDGGLVVGGCQNPPDYDPLQPEAPVPAIPWVSIFASQGQALETLLSTKPVSISVTGHSTPDYLYVVSTNFERDMPVSAARTLTAEDLTAETTTISPFQANDSEVTYLDSFGLQPESPGGGGAAYIDTTSSAPQRVTIYTSSMGPDAELHTTASAGDDDWHFLYSQQRLDSQLLPGTTTVGYGSAPFTIGAQSLPANAGASGFVDYCIACRQGNDFLPAVEVVAGAVPDAYLSAGFLANAQLTSNGVAVPPDSYGVGYTLPPESATYQFIAHADDADYSWTFSSSAPKDDATPPGTACLDTALQNSSDLCTPVPLVFVRYAAPVDGRNQAPSGTSQTVKVTAYHEGEQGPAIIDLTTQVSFDHGKTWMTARVSPTSTSGTYTATFAVPALVDTDGYVSIRTTAQDAAGNSTDQTYYDSYALK